MSAKNKNTFKDAMQNWQDFDGAQYNLAICLGIIDAKYNFHIDTKHVFWTDNSLGNMLYAILENMRDEGILEHNEDELQFRWNPNYKGCWEK